MKNKCLFLAVFALILAAMMFPFAHNAMADTGGIVGSTVHFVGEVIAFPFKLVGNLVEAIF